MFERFTHSAREVVILAQEEARGLQHSYIGTEHELLGLLGEQNSLAARVLGSLGITVERVREEVLRVVGRGEKVTVRQIPFTPRAKEVLELAWREAEHLGGESVGPEHILLGMLRDDQDLAVRILVGCGADVEKIRGQITRALGGPRTSGRVRGSSAGRHPVDQTWFGPLGAHLNALAAEILREIERETDTGDLLIALACDADAIAGEALKELGVDLNVLSATIVRLRAGNHAEREITLRTEKRAIGVVDTPENAACVQDEGRRRRRQQRAHEDGILTPEVLTQIRRHLGLREPGPGKL